MILSKDELNIVTGKLRQYRGEGWGQGSPFNALRKATIIYLNKVITSYQIKSNQQKEKFISKQDFKELRQSFFIQRDSNSIKIGDFLDKYKGKDYIKVSAVEELINTNNIHAKGITKDNYVKFLKKQWLEEGIFNVFYELFDLDKIKFQGVEKYLNKFNHEKQISLVAGGISNEKIFVNINPCPYSQTWLLRRFVEKVKELDDEKNFNVKLHEIGKSQNKVYTPSNLLQEFTQTYPIDKLPETLDDNHLIICLNINEYDLGTLKTEIIECFWKQLNETVKSRQGFLILFLKRDDNWDENYTQDDYLSKYLVKLPQANPYNQNDLATFIDETSLKFNQRLQDDSQNIAQTFLQQAQNQTDKLIIQLYNLFGCKLTPQYLIQTWKTYP